MSKSITVLFSECYLFLSLTKETLKEDGERVRSEFDRVESGESIRSVWGSGRSLSPKKRKLETGTYENVDSYHLQFDINLTKSNNRRKGWVNAMTGE